MHLPCQIVCLARKSAEHKTPPRPDQRQQAAGLAGEDEGLAWLLLISRQIGGDRPRQDATLQVAHSRIGSRHWWWTRRGNFNCRATARWHLPFVALQLILCQI